MKMARINKSISLVLSVLLIAVMAVAVMGCKEEKGTYGTIKSEGGTMGEGKTVFSLTVTDGEGKETDFEIHTDKKTVGEALTELNLIAGDEGPYGLYVKEVNGITADYDTDGKFWAFYINGKQASGGVDTTNIKKGESYSLRVE